MKRIKKLLLIIIVIALCMNIARPLHISAATSSYGVIIGNKENEFKLYNNLIVLSPSKNLMVKAYQLSKELGLSFNYNKSTKKLTIKNPYNKKSVVFTLDKKEFNYYSSTTAKASKKTATYACYYDSKAGTYVIHIATLQYIVNYNYYKNMDNYYSDMGYKALAAYSINGYSSYDIPMTKEVLNYVNSKTFKTKEQLLDAIRINFIMRNNSFSLNTNRGVMDALGTGSSVIDHVKKLDRKDTSKDADYLSLVIDQIKQSWYSTHKNRINADGTVTSIQEDSDPASLTIEVKYETTLAQERIVDNKIYEILKKILKENTTEFQKVKAIHDYVINLASYDTSYQRSSAYDILIHKTAVCEGYALVAYRLLLDAGLENRVIIGLGNNELHAWNIVKVDGKWYNLDLTWDDPISSSGKPILRYDYFLKNTKDFINHTRDAEFTTSKFMKTYPIAAKSYSW